MRQTSFINRPGHPQANTNFISKVIFWYTLKIFYKVSKKGLKEDDLPEPLQEHTSSYLGAKLSDIWTKEVDKTRKKNEPNIRRALYKCFRVEIWKFSLVAVFLELVVKISQPLFLKLILRYYSADNLKSLESNSYNESNYTFLWRMFYIYDSKQGPISKGEAAFFTFGIILSSWLNISITHPYLMGVMHLGMKMRIACCSLMYRKALKLKLELAGGNVSGNMINLLSNDVNRFDNGIMFLSYFLLIPLQIAFVTYFIYMEVGFPAIYGIISLIFIIPIQMWLAVRVIYLRRLSDLKTDDRVREMNEVIQAIQVIKMYTWEQIFINIIFNYRATEIKYMKQMGYIKGVLMSLIIFSFRFSVFIISIAYVLMNDEITAEKIFVVTAFLLILRQTVTVFLPQMLAQGAELLVSLNRIQDFLCLPEITKNNDNLTKSSMDLPDSLDEKSSIELDDSFIKINNASTKFGETVVLKNINLEASPGILTVIIGPVGSGKSCLLHLIQGELSQFEGNVETNGRISYASQEPWIFAGTVRENILFGHEFDKKRYEEVCYVCGLTTDFKLFPYGDQTQVGEKGATLSGGQKARVNLARAIYKRADIYLLDDPLSAVDTNVGQHLFEECITGYIADKIVVLVTHQLQYLEEVDQIVLMKDGIIETIGNYEHLKGAGLDFSQLIAEQLADKHQKTPRSSKHSRRSSIRATLAEVTRKTLFDVTLIDKENQERKRPQMTKETASTDKVKCSTYKAYFKASKFPLGLFWMFFLFIITQLFASGSDYFISKWINMEESTEMQISRNTCITIYSTIISATIIMALIRSFHFFQLCMACSKNLHNTMFQSMIETTTYFFNKHSSGQILNRFSKDLGAVDELLPNALIDTLQIFLNLIGVIIVIGIINPYLLIPTLLMCLIFYKMRSFYLKTGSNIKRLEGITRSPVFSHTNSTLIGLTTIRSHKAEELLISEFDRHQDIHSSAWFIFISTSRAFGYWLDNICIIYIMLVSYSFLFVNSQDGQIGLAITQTMSLIGLFQWGLRQSAEVENQMISVERLLEYTKLEPEPNLKCDPFHEPPIGWPSSGTVEFSHVYMKYGPEDANILMDVNFLIRDTEKVGIVGRTGAGKSSLIAALFHLAYFYGELRIDNLDINQLCLHNLRKKISIIPQEPVLFSGTLRYNLDPFDDFDNYQILKVLRDLENKDAISSGEDCLKLMIVEGGANISVGQRQIICLGRVLLRKNRIVVMDEATANIDAKTDKFIQSIIKTRFHDCTVITIAHRLHTIMDSDKVLVMDAGKVAEFDHPHILLQNPGGIFTGMVDKTGESMADNLRRIARETYERMSTLT